MSLREDRFYVLHGIAYAAGYYVPCLFVNGWDPLLAAAAWLVMAGFLTVLVLVGVAIGHFADADEESRLHGATRWVQNKLDNDDNDVGEESVWARRSIEAKVAIIVAALVAPVLFLFVKDWAASPPEPLSVIDHQGAVRESGVDECQDLGFAEPARTETCASAFVLGAHHVWDEDEQRWLTGDELEHSYATDVSSAFRWLSAGEEPNFAQLADLEAWNAGYFAGASWLMKHPAND